MVGKKKKLFNYETANKFVDLALSLEGKPNYEKVSRMCANYNLIFQLEDPVFRNMQRDSFNFDNLFHDPVYQKVKDIYHKSLEKGLDLGEKESFRKVSNYTIDVAKRLYERKGLGEKEYNKILHQNESDLVKEIVNSENVLTSGFANNIFFRIGNKKVISKEIF